MFIIAVLNYIKEITGKYTTRKQLSSLDPSRYDDIAMSSENIRNEVAKGKVHYLLLELFTFKGRS
ncbi:hypothetical protein [Marinomonas sp. 2405UD68-3]|uniref:hypothetical protein n=1 Tax=Marinomonas sp. 2405UD68-3 TaxID=3391835 RepID=UPI0039C92C6B